MTHGPVQEPARADKAQFNVYLPKGLIRRAKYASVDTGQSLSRLVEEALTAHLDRLDKEGTRDAMKVMPIRYVADVAAATRFYAALGLVQGDSSRSGNWTELNAAGGVLALHTAQTEEQDTPGRVELAFETQEPLETLAGRLTAAGFEPEAIVDENFGRSLRVIDPDGVLVQVNEHDRELYT